MTLLNSEVVVPELRQVVRPRDRVWNEKYWLDFDNDWWRDTIALGRLIRSRIDLFLQYWLTLRITDEIPTYKVFDQFRKPAADTSIAFRPPTRFSVPCAPTLQAYTQGTAGRTQTPS